MQFFKHFLDIIHESGAFYDIFFLYLMNLFIFFPFPGIASFKESINFYLHVVYALNIYHDFYPISVQYFLIFFDSIFLFVFGLLIIFILTLIDPFISYDLPEKYK